VSFKHAAQSLLEQKSQKSPLATREGPVIEDSKVQQEQQSEKLFVQNWDKNYDLEEQKKEQLKLQNQNVKGKEEATDDRDKVSSKFNGTDGGEGGAEAQRKEAKDSGDEAEKVADEAEKVAAQAVAAEAEKAEAEAQRKEAEHSGDEAEKAEAEAQRKDTAKDRPGDDSSEISNSQRDSGRLQELASSGRRKVHEKRKGDEEGSRRWNNQEEVRRDSRCARKQSCLSSHYKIRIRGGITDC